MIPNSEQLDLFPDIPSDTTDILHVKVGIEGVWIPDREQLVNIQREWATLVPKGMKVIATAIGQEAIRIKVKDE